jgi:hypothetical protein
MALEMRAECERCHSATPERGLALICTYECTFCDSCATSMGNVCPNCGGELVARPRKN